ncbi:MAG: hypothetical protein ABIS51_18450 [Sphingomonas sp.]
MGVFDDAGGDDAQLNVRVAALEAQVTTLGATVSANAAAAGDALTGEASTREAEDLDIRGGIDAEQAARILRDQQLADMIADEITARVAGDAIYVTQIAGEATARAAADTALGGQIAAEATTRGAADTALAAQIAAEATTRGAADTVLAAQIAAEVTARGAADTSLAAQIAAEATTRGTADAALNTRVSALEVKTSFYADSDYGSDANDGLTQATPKKTLAALVALGAGKSGVTFALARGSHWYGEYPDFSASPWCRVISYGQGTRPVIDGALALFTGAWVINDTYPNVWMQPITLPHVTQGAGPGDANQWHIAMWDEEANLTGNGIGTSAQMDTSYVKRVLNGDPIPDPASYDIDQPKTTTIAVASQAALMAIVNAWPNSFTVFPAAPSTSYEPRGLLQTQYVVCFHAKDGSNPNANGRTLRITEQPALAILAKGQDVHDVVFCRNGGKDMLSGFQFLPTPRHNPSDLGDVFSGNFYNCDFLQAAAHGPVVCGMSGYDCTFEGVYTRDSYSFSCAPFHNFRSSQGVNKSRGYEWVRCRATRFGYMFYSHGVGDGLAEHTIARIEGGHAKDGIAITVGGQTAQGYHVRNMKARDVEALGATPYPQAIYEECVIYLRAGVVNYMGDGVLLAPAPAVGKLRLVDCQIFALGTKLVLPQGGLSALTSDQFPILELERSVVWAANGILNSGNANYMQLHVEMKESYIGPWDSTSTIDSEVWPAGTFVADARSIIETLRTTPDTLRARYAGVASGVQTGMVKQVWQRTIQAGDLVYVAANNAMDATGWVDNGNGTATVATTFNYGTANLSRGIKIAGIQSGGGDFTGVVRGWIDLYHIIVAPVPTGASSASGAITIAFYRPNPFRDPVTAYLSANGTQLNVSDASGMVVGQILRVAHPIAGRPGYGIRTIAAITGTIVTLDTPCPWLQRSDKTTYRAIATPTSGTGRSLPQVILSWGFPIQNRVLHDESYTLPKCVVTPVEGGADLTAMQQLDVLDGTFIQPGLVNLAFNSVGTAAPYTNANYEAGYWSQAFGVAIGDVLTLTCEVDVAEYRMAFATPPELGGYAPVPSCLPAQRRIGFRPSI